MTPETLELTEDADDEASAILERVQREAARKPKLQKDTYKAAADLLGLTDGVLATAAMFATEPEASVLREAVQRIRGEGQHKPPPSWSPSWPTAPGWYWFYGWEFGANAGVEATLETVEVFDAGRALVYIRNGRGLCKEKGATGLWLPLQTPELPEGEKA